MRLNEGLFVSQRIAHGYRHQGSRRRSKIRLSLSVSDLSLAIALHQLGEQIHESPSKLLEKRESNSTDLVAYTSAAEQISLSLFELYLSLHELSKYKIYVNETFVVALTSSLERNSAALLLAIERI